jgi:pimeloyl-ACP methyl ester carboxylesterase
VTLEILSRLPPKSSRRPPLLFVHGAFAGAWCWDEYFLPWFSARGYPAHAVSLRGHAGSTLSASLDSVSLEDYVADTVAAAAQLDAPPVLIGHSMGGIVVQRAARACNAIAMALLAPVPPQGLGSSIWSLATRDPPLFLGLGMMQLGGNANSARRARNYLFSKSLSEADAIRYLTRMQRESQRALMDLTWPQRAWIESSVGVPAFVVGAERDAFFTRGMVEETARLHGVSPAFFPGMAHVMMLEPGWQDVAERVCAWLDALQEPSSVWTGASRGST